MVHLHQNLSQRLTQTMKLTPGLMQMVSVLALNKLELKDMISAEMEENPVLEELENSVPLIDDVGRQEEERDRVSSKLEENPIIAGEKKDPFEEIDFDSYFKDYLDPGFRSPGQMEEIERPSFENFLSKGGNLTDHLTWQLGTLDLRPAVREAADLVVGNLSEDGYLLASDEELLGVEPPVAPETDAAMLARIASQAADLLQAAADAHYTVANATELQSTDASTIDLASPAPPEPDHGILPANPPLSAPAIAPAPSANGDHAAHFTLADLHEAIEIVRLLDPPGVACRDLRECLRYQLNYRMQLAQHKAGEVQTIADAIAVVDCHLHAVQLKQFREIGKAMGRPVEAVQAALAYLKNLDPFPGLQYNKVTARVIEPDVAFVKHGDDWLVLMNDEDLPTLRLSPSYKRLAERSNKDKETRNYLKERYTAAKQLIKNIEQRKQTIAKVCYSILARQSDFLEKGIAYLRPMMIKEVAEEIGVHPSTVSRAVMNKYAHTPQGVFELRYFFSERVNTDGGQDDVPLLVLKLRVKKLIEEEDSSRPLTDEHLTRMLQQQGIRVTRRTVAKYREDMRIPSTHQRRVKA